MLFCYWIVTCPLETVWPLLIQVQLAVFPLTEYDAAVLAKVPSPGTVMEFQPELGGGEAELMVNINE